MIAVGRPGGHVLVREGVGHDVLLCCVDPVGEPAGSARPGLGRHLIGSPPLEQDLVVLGEPFDDRTHDVRVEEPHRPAAVLEAAADVLGRAAEGLHDPVQTHELTDDNSHITLQSGCLLAVTTNADRPIDTPGEKVHRRQAGTTPAPRHTAGLCHWVAPRQATQPAYRRFRDLRDHASLP